MNETIHSSSIPHLHIGSNHSHDDVPFANLVEGFIHTDAEKLMETFSNAYNKIRGDLRRPRVLIAGTTGSGKSSIINTVFGSELAREGAGKPVTQNFQKFCPDNQLIILYDSKGLESGMQLEEVVNSTKNFFMNQCNDDRISNSKSGIEGQIHLVWYVINAAGARFQDFEEKLCRELFSNIPIVFLLNKADIATREQLDALKDVINKLDFLNVIGVVETVTRSYSKSRPPEVCANCQSGDDLVIQKRLKIATCDTCKVSTPFIEPMGLHELLELTFSTLPNIAKEAFVSAQKLNFKLKEKRAKRIISEFFEEQSHVFLPQGFIQIIAKMLTRLSFVWDFKDHGHLLGTHIAKDLMHSFSLRDKLFLFVHKNKHQKLRATAIGIIWNRCVRDLAKIVLVETVEGMSLAQVNQQWSTILEDAFQDLREDVVDHLEDLLTETELAEVLDLEMPENPINRATEESRKCSIPELLHSECWNGFINYSDSTPDISPMTSPSTSPRGHKKRSKHKHKRQSKHRKH